MLPRDYVVDNLFPATSAFELVHGEDMHREPTEILQTAITTNGADLSATEKRNREQAAASAAWRLQAQTSAAWAADRVCTDVPRTLVT